MSARDDFLRRVRQAVADGNAAGAAPPLPQRRAVGYQGAGPDLVAACAEQLTAAGGTCHLVPDAAAALDGVLALVRACSARKVLLGGGPFLDALPLGPALAGAGVELLAAGAGRAAFFAADVGITGVDYLVAETGSLARVSRPGQPRSLSLLPPVHVAVAHPGQLLPDLFDLFAAEGWGQGGEWPACLTLITGPSKTGDIELRLVTGVHGPGEVH